MWVWVWAWMFVAALCVTACGATEATSRDRRESASAWRTMPPGPLSAREGAVGVWTGQELLLIGGSDAPPCPPNASCVPPDAPPLADGAAFNPGTGTWRPITDSPVPFEWARGVVIGGAVYLWIPGAPGRPNAPRAFLAYRIGPDRWQELPLPPAALERDYTIAGAGGRVVAYTGSDEGGEHPDFVFDPAAASWTELSPDPLSPSFDRSMAWSGRELILFDHELIANPGSERPALTRAAALDLESGTWRRLPDSEILATGPWVRADGHLVNPTLGGTDGGETNNWGRTYFYGGILDPGRGAWLPLPNPPPDQDVPSAGVRTDSGADYFGASGWVFDAATNSWTLIPPPDTDGVLTGQTVVAAGRDLFVFGGARWNSDHSSGKLLRDAWIWSPESARVVR